MFLVYGFYGMEDKENTAFEVQGVVILSANGLKTRLLGLFPRMGYADHHYFLVLFVPNKLSFEAKVSFICVMLLLIYLLFILQE